MGQELSNRIGRRSFLKETALIGVGLGTGVWPLTELFDDETQLKDVHIIGPREGFSPHLGTLVAMMTWMRHVLLSSVNHLSVDELDYLVDKRSNSIGALLLHLAALERQYQLSTFNWSARDGAEKVNWEAALQLGNSGRSEIRGNNLDYYTKILTETRTATVKEFRRRNDSWLAKVDPRGFEDKPTNNYCKWFHVCEHEANHNGQIKWIRSRIPQKKD